MFGGWCPFFNIYVRLYLDARLFSLDDHSSANIAVSNLFRELQLAVMRDHH